MDNLLYWMRSSEELGNYEKLLLEGVPHLPLIYEQHLFNDENHQSTAELVCKYLNIECSTAETEYRKVSPKALQDSVANYDELVNFLKDSQYAKCLE